MKSRVFFVFLLVVISKSSFASGVDDTIESAVNRAILRVPSSSGKIAVMEFPSFEGKSNQLSSYISSKATNLLIRAGRKVVDHGSLSKVLEAQKIPAGTILDAPTGAKVGKASGADVLFIGNYALLSNKFVVTVRALGVAQGEVLATGEATLKLDPALRTELTDLVHEEPKKEVVQVREAPVVASASVVAPIAVVSAPAKVEPELTAEQEFHKWLCKYINSSAKFAAVIGKAMELGLEDIESISGSIAVYGRRVTDQTGELYEYVYSLQGWDFVLGHNRLDQSTVGSMIKGSDMGVKIGAWKYNRDLDDVEGHEKCLAHGANWWVTARADGLAPRKVRKK